MITSPTSSSSDHTSNTAAPRGRRSRVSAEHTLNRVRENQRRHRARQRDHVASLEQKLAETEKLLDEARAEIAALKGQTNNSHQPHSQQRQNVNNEVPRTAARVERHVEEGNTTPNTCTMQDIPAPSSPSSQQTSLALAVQPDALLDPQLAYPDIPDLSDLSFLSDTASFYLPSASSTMTGSLLSSSPGLSHDLAVISTPTSNTNTTNNTTTTLTITGPPPCCSDPPTPTTAPVSMSPSSAPPSNDIECSSCRTKPPPSPSESTTLCAQAFVMIGQQNFRNLDPDTIRLWLAQGLRRAQREGEGCRVENGALLRLLDFISGL
jgi:hypothetical protein